MFAGQGLCRCRYNGHVVGHLAHVQARNSRVSCWVVLRFDSVVDVDMGPCLAWLKIMPSQYSAGGTMSISTAS